MGAGRRVILTMAGGGLAALALAAPAGATEVQDAATDQAYTGPYAAANSGDAVVTSSSVHFTCAETGFSGDVTDAGGTGVPALADLQAFALRNSSGDLSCDSDTVPFVINSFTAEGLPWAIQFDWLGDDMAGARNGTATLAGVQILADLDLLGPHLCTYSGNANGTANTDKEIVGDVFNPDNTASGNTELVFTTAPLAKTSGDDFCGNAANFTVTYTLTGDAGEKLQLRDPPAPPVGGGGGNSGGRGSSGGSAGTTGGSKQKRKCSKKKKGKNKKGKGKKSAAAAKKKKKSKKKNCGKKKKRKRKKAK